jgi:Predicted Zn-dependent peptidases, insulinase-like
MTELHGFELVWERNISELNTFAQLFRHRKTGAELLSLQNDDENKVFGITFRTPPSDSTGIAHILEHSVLCGSRKYPLKEPFVELLKGSLKTFLNAMTYPDKTVYPVASQNLQDFYNLTDVYLDAVFYPRITPDVLQQEGWHYELESLDAPLTYKGVVFNEMKGAYSSPERNLYEAAQQSLFPDTTYGVSSGGHPRHIPDLSYEQFKRFHETFYHPSNSRIYFYGDDPVEERLRIVNEYLKDFDKIEVDSSIALQSRFSEPRAVERSYAASADSDNSKKFMTTLNWLLAESNDPQLNLGLTILDDILLGSPAAPLRKALIDSGLGDDVVGGGLNDGLLQLTFSVGLKGIREQDAPAVHELILKTLKDLVDNGIETETIEASLNSVEFSLRENNTGSAPRGLVVMLRALDAWLYDRNPLDGLTFEEPLSVIKKLAFEGYFEDLIRRYLLENTHRTSVLLRPDPELAAREEADEAARLAAIRASMNEEQLKEVMASAAHLKELQERPDSPEALASIPSLKLSDLDRQNKRIPIEVQEIDGTPFISHDLHTNGIVYFDLGFDLRSVPAALLPYVPLFGRALTEMGTEQEDFVKLSQRIGRNTGGVWVSRLTSLHNDRKQHVAWFLLRGKAMADQAEKLFDIMRDVLLGVKLNNQERFRQMVLKAKAGLEAGLIPSGHSFVNLRMRSKFNTMDWIDEQLGGISYLFFLRQLSEAVENNWPSVLARLEEVRSLLINRRRALVNVTLDQATTLKLQPQIKALLDALPSHNRPLVEWHGGLSEGNEGLTLPAQVNYVGKAANLYDLGYEYNASAAVISRYLRTTWLWEKVRMQGGAYGGFCSFDRLSGVFSFTSYRDPNLLGTLENYDLASRFLKELKLNDDELTKSIIGAIGDIDAYQLPDAKGYTSLVRYLLGDSEERLQQARDQIFATKAEDFRTFGELLEKFNEVAQVVVLGSTSAIEAANRERNDFLQLVKVL